MKKLFLIAFVLTGLGVNAQYFQSLYGSKKIVEFLSDGHNTYNTGPGHFLVGPSDFLPGPLFPSSPFTINVQKTDLSGSTTAPGTFNNHYTVTDIGGAFPALNPNLLNHDVHSLELSDGSGFALASSYSGGVTNVGFGLYLHIMDNMGNPQFPVPNTYGWYPNGNYRAIGVQSIIESTKYPGMLYICGFVTEAATNYNKIFVIKTDKFGTVYWDHIYDLDYNNANNSDVPFDMVEAPALHPAHNVDEFWIVGSSTDYSTASPNVDAFILRIDDIYGNTLNPITFYGAAATSDAFTGIITTSNALVDPSGQGAGFVISGYTDMNGSYDFWSIAMDNTHAIAWTNTYNYMINGMPTPNQDYANHLMERINTMGVEEYYLVGTTDFGVKGFDDVVVFKTDNMGNLVPTGQFTYGDVDADRGVRIDQLNGFGPNTDGIAVYCQTSHSSVTIGGFDHLLVKAYFNGVTACEEDQQDGDQRPGPGYIKDINTDNTGPNNFTDFTMQIDLYATLTELNICSSPAVPGGDNSRIAPEEPKGDNQGTVSPNPMAQGVQYANVEIEVDGPVTAQVAVYDILGRTYYNHTFTLVKGKNNLTLDMSDANMAQGMYSIKITGENLNKSIMLLVK